MWNENNERTPRHCLTGGAMELTGVSLGICLVFDRFDPNWRSGRMRSATLASCSRAPPFPWFEHWGHSPEKVRMIFYSGMTSH